MTETTVYFDDSLPQFVAALVNVIGTRTAEAGWVVRDSGGKLCFIGATPLDEDLKRKADEKARELLGSYARDGWIVADIQMPGAGSVIRQARPYHEQVSLGEQRVNIKIIDQRIVGIDWLNPPSNKAPGIPRYVFASIKGGVGRSTAVAVAARDLAMYGYKVLVVDLDLEAPGIGSILLSIDELPRYGMLDALVESGIGGLSDDFYLDMVAASEFGGGKGLIDVVPAVGASARSYPENVLAKLARAYLDAPEIEGVSGGFASRTRALLDHLCTLKRYDAVLVDARAGLNEASAPAILSLGANVLLFGEDTPQTISGYRFLLSHLSRFDRVPEDDWLDRVKVVHAKASLQATSQQAFRDRMYDVFKEFVYREQRLEDVTLPEFSLDDTEAPHYALPIARDDNYFEFDPLSEPSVLTASIYERTYEPLLNRLNPTRAEKTQTN